MKRETANAAVALAIAPLLLVTLRATAQGPEGALARASFIEAPKDDVPAVPSGTEAPKPESSGETQPAQQPAQEPETPPPAKPAESTPPAAEQPATGQPPAGQSTPADPKQPADAAQAQRQANEADAAQEEAATAAKAPKRFIPTQKTQADSSATFPIDI